MTINDHSKPQTTLGTTISWVLAVLILGLILAYLLLGRAVIGEARQQLFEQRARGQQAVACTLGTLLDAELRHGSDVVGAFERLAPGAVPGSAAELGIALVDATGSSVARVGSAELSLAGNLSVLEVRDPLSGVSVPLTEYIAMSEPPGGRLYSAAGLDLGQTVAATRLTSGGWSVIVQQSTRRLQEAAGRIQLYLLLCFLALAVLLLLVVLWVYLAVASMSAAAVETAGALRTATTAFQESLGVLRGPLHSIQGLADMLSITEDLAERHRYLDDIKAEVRKMIGLFKQVEL